MNPPLKFPDAEAMRRPVRSPMARWVGFLLGEQHYALPIVQVHEVFARIDIEPVPQSGPFVRGVTNVRGRIVTVLDLHHRLGVVGGPREEGSMIVAEVNGEPVAFQVDRITSLHSVAADAIKPAPAVCRDQLDPAVCGLIHGEHGLVTLLGMPGLLAGISPQLTDSAA
jgi:purine-binding chemotaxis protein CheW